MTFLSLAELGRMLIMTAAVAVIFRRWGPQGPLARQLMIAALISAPGIILHELGHKFVALGFGLDATFQIPIFWLAIGIVLSLVNAPFLFFVPAYVSIGAGATPLQSMLIAFAGPTMNGLLYLIARLALSKMTLSHRSAMLWTMTRKINGFLFLFNLIPIPPFDGFSVLAGLLRTFGV